MKPLATRPPPAPLYVLGEGEDERHFFEQLCRVHGIEGVHCLQYDGRDALRGDLASLRSILEPAVRTLLIVQDADDAAAVAFTRVRDALAANGFPAPDASNVLAVGAPATCVLILPGDGQAGTGVRRAVPRVHHEAQSSVDSRCPQGTDPRVAHDPFAR